MDLSRRPTVADGWVQLMEADKIAGPVDCFEDALGWAHARGQHRGRKQKIRRHDVNGKAYWAIHDAPVEP